MSPAPQASTPRPGQQLIVGPRAGPRSAQLVGVAPASDIAPAASGIAPVGEALDPEQAENAEANARDTTPQTAKPCQGSKSVLNCPVESTTSPLTRRRFPASRTHVSMMTRPALRAAAS